MSLTLKFYFSSDTPFLFYIDPFLKQRYFPEDQVICVIEILPSLAGQEQLVAISINFIMVSLKF